MYLEKVIVSFMNHISDSIELDYLLLDGQDGANPKYYVYNPSLAFEPVLQKRMAYMKYEDREDPFICAMWNKGAIDAVPTQARQFTAGGLQLISGTADKYRIKNVKTPLNIVFVSNDPEYLSTFEEVFTILYDRTVNIHPTYTVPTDYELVGNTNGLDIAKKYIKLPTFSNDIEKGDSVSLLNVNYSTPNKITPARLRFTVNYTKELTDGNTLIYVNEALPDDLVGGKLYKNDGVTDIKATVFCRDIIHSEIEKLDTQSRGELLFLKVSLVAEYPVLLHKNSDKVILKITQRTRTGVAPKDGSIEEPYDEQVIQADI